MQWLPESDQGLLDLRKLPPASPSSHYLTPTRHWRFSICFQKLSHQFSKVTLPSSSRSDLLSQRTLSRTSFLPYWHASLPHTQLLSVRGKRNSLSASTTDTSWNTHYGKRNREKEISNPHKKEFLKKYFPKKQSFLRFRRAFVVKITRKCFAP